MDLQWHIRLVDRLIKNNPDATIKDYLRIVDKETENENVDLARRSIEIRNAVVVEPIEFEPEPKVVRARKRKSYPRLKRGLIL